MTKTHNIEIEGLPEGWKAVAYRCPKKFEHYFDAEEKRLLIAPLDHGSARLIVEKIKPHRIVLEETNEVRRPRYGEYFREGLIDSKVELCTSHNYEYAVRIWTVVEDGE